MCPLFAAESAEQTVGGRADDFAIGVETLVCGGVVWLSHVLCRHIFDSAFGGGICSQQKIVCQVFEISVVCVTHLTSLNLKKSTISIHRDLLAGRDQLVRLRYSLPLDLRCQPATDALSGRMGTLRNRPTLVQMRCKQQQPHSPQHQHHHPHQQQQVLFHLCCSSRQHQHPSSSHAR